jgi:hypothetical protein
VLGKLLAVPELSMVFWSKSGADARTGSRKPDLPSRQLEARRLSTLARDVETVSHKPDETEPKLQ